MHLDLGGTLWVYANINIKIVYVLKTTMKYFKNHFEILKVKITSN